MNDLKARCDREAERWLKEQTGNEHGGLVYATALSALLYSIIQTERTAVEDGCQVGEAGKRGTVTAGVVAALFLLLSVPCFADEPKISVGGAKPVHPRGSDPARVAQVYGGPQVTVGDYTPKHPRGADPMRWLLAWFGGWSR